ncbi:TetR/AcrR family transcriptional regulator [Marinifilum sp.]|uniref:TetR/AcrR family transcriptional regulator n=1 Tax=Marinifilum sp. TaxID=2033137 RepID=UPI003BA89C13
MAKTDKIEIKERVMTLSMEMMMRFGLRGLNMIDLAKECGLAKATLYKIIGTKEDLIRQIAFEIFDRNIINILQPYRTKDDPIEVTKEFLDNYFDYAISAQKILIQQIYKEYPLIEKDVENKYQHEMDIVIKKYNEWQEKGLIRQDVNVNYCIEALQALNDFYIMGTFSENEVIDRLRQSFICMLRGMGVEI